MFHQNIILSISLLKKNKIYSVIREPTKKIKVTMAQLLIKTK